MNKKRVRSSTAVALVSILALSACNSNTTEGGSEKPADLNKALFFDYGAEWRYLDLGVAPDANWTEVIFDDADWKQGSGIFSYGYDYPLEGNTALTDYKTLNWEGETPSAYYFRKSVDVADIETLHDVYLKMRVDDAAAIYVNGAEIARSPLLIRDEALSNTTSPLRYSKYANNAENTFVLPKQVFKEGENVIAVAVYNQVYHQTNDVQFNAALSASFEYTGEPDGPYVTVHEDGVISTQSVTQQGVIMQTFNNASDAEIIVSLPGELGEFKVELKDEYSVPAYRYEKPAKFFVTSDLEGQIEAMVYMLVQAGVMDEAYNWTYGNGHLYHLGDLFDRGAFVTESLWLFYHLENQAQKAGGDVHFILGNHDLMNFYGDFRYVHPRYFENASLMGKTLLELHTKETVLGQWLRTKNVMEVAGDLLIVHAGFNNDLIAAIQDGSLTLDAVNEYGRQHLDNGYIRYDDQGNLIKDAYYLPSRLYWDRSIPDGALSQEALEAGLTAFGASQVVVGHTVFDKPAYLYNERVIVADVDHGDNYYVEGRVQALEYYYGNYQHFIADKASGVMRLPLESTTPRQ
ncbi:metallophosphoesterase [Thaumasiovibrio subtropicus]|uniref:metallophosphoesterase n=1 Tax=Thaumasiovibrio subtropicus TaxID=1891207 RepID=UPI000B35DA36|nr:metallophosphoesterase [Thaumasiovibrio subtropicus]